jgi:hypothetical protein
LVRDESINEFQTVGGTRHFQLAQPAQSRSRRRDQKIRFGYVNARQYYGMFPGALNRQQHIGSVDLRIIFERRLLEKKK